MNLARDERLCSIDSSASNLRIRTPSPVRGKGGVVDVLPPPLLHPREVHDVRRPQPFHQVVGIPLALEPDLVVAPRMGVLAKHRHGHLLEAGDPLLEVLVPGLDDVHPLVTRVCGTSRSAMGAAPSAARTTVRCADGGRVPALQRTAHSMDKRRTRRSSSMSMEAILEGSGGANGASVP